MTAGDIKDSSPTIITVTSGAAIAVGQLCHLEADGFWDPAVLTDLGTFGVALDAASAAAETIRMMIGGAVEVTATAAAIPKGAKVMAGSTGLVVLSDHGVFGENVGIALEAFASGGNGTILLTGE